MTTYVYKCTDCGHELEAEQRMTDKPMTKCPQCKKLKLRRVIQSTGFKLKGKDRTSRGRA